MPKPPRHILKICRVNDHVTASHLVRLEVDLLGFHLITEDDYLTKPNIVSAASYVRTNFNYHGNVALTKSTSMEFIDRILSENSFSYLQLHRRASELDLSYIRAICNTKNVKLILVFDPGIDDYSYYKTIVKYADILLFDQSSGGTGRVLQMSDLEAYKGGKFILAGGINSENIGERIGLYDPIGFDIQSSTERAKGLKRFGMIRGIRKQLDPDFPSSVGIHRRSELYYSATDTASHRLPAVMSTLSSVIDGVHLDHASGVFNERYQRTSLECAAALTVVAPDTPYDLHFFVSPFEYLNIVDQYLAVNPNIIRVWIPIEMSVPIKSTDLFELVEQLRIRGIRPALSILASDIHRDIRAIVKEQVLQNRIYELCLVGLAPEKDADLYAETVLSALRYIRQLSDETGAPLWCLLDRGVTEERLAKLCGSGINAVTIGKALTSSADPRSFAERVIGRLEDKYCAGLRG